VQRRRTTPSGGTRTWRYAWNGENRLVGLTTPDQTRWRYRYDAFGRRTAKERLAGDGSIAERVEFAWDGFALAEQLSAAGATAWDWAEDGFRALTQRELPAAVDAVDQRFYAIVTDLVGTPTELVAPDGTLARSARASLWGSTTATGLADCPLRFPGQYHDPESGLDYNQQRHYDAEAGRYLSPDPMGLAGGPDPHAYVPNPTRWVDPLGLTPCDPADLFRSMRDAGGVPEVGPSARTLGARPGTDIPVDSAGMVHPNTGGVSVSPGSPTNLPEFRRPPEFGGTGKDPVWTINERDLPDGLSYRPDPANPTGHGLLEPSRSMALSDYQQLLEVTRPGWSRVVAGGG
jgi:RHS repeat-associated protein